MEVWGGVGEEVAGEGEDEQLEVEEEDEQEEEDEVLQVEEDFFLIME